MPRPLGWTDVRALAEALEAAHPDVDLDRLRSTDLPRWISELPRISGCPNAFNDKQPQAIHPPWPTLRE